MSRVNPHKKKHSWVDVLFSGKGTGYEKSGKDRRKRIKAMGRKIK